MHNEEAQGNEEVRGEENKPEVVRTEDTGAGETGQQKPETPEPAQHEPGEQKAEEQEPEEPKTEEPSAEETVSHSVVGIRFEPCGKVYRFQANGLGLKRGERVVVESELGVSIGRVVIEDEEQKGAGKELKPVLRRVTEDDLKQEEDNKAMKKEAFDFCNERIMARGLAMKLLGTDVTLDKKRIVFFFSAETRIDFRELVKDLAAKFRTRIELRQVGVRDAARITGGLGVCGRELCCRRFLTSFLPISIKMAKKQELALNTSKLSGICGRLMCCLGYEYEDKLKELKELKKRERKEPEERKVEQKREQRPEQKEAAVETAPAAPEPARTAPGTEAPASTEEGAPSRKRRRRRRRRSGKRPDAERSEAQGQRPAQSRSDKPAPGGKPAEATAASERPTGERPSGEKPSGDKPAEGAAHAKKPFRRKRRRRMKGKKKE